MNAREIIDSLKPTGESGELKGSFDWEGSRVNVTVDPDEATLEEALAFTLKLLENFEDFFRRSKDELLDKCLSMYNDDWRDDDEPVLSAEQFLANFHLKSVWILGDKCVDFFYDESGMFGHHSMIPQVFDGENFDGVMMYG